MSLTLGPIHYWLYKKINNQEQLTLVTAQYAEKSGWIIQSSEYTKQLQPLETVIDTSNIHGWLQEQISDTQSRYANLITKIITDDSSRINHIKQIATDFGKQYAPDANANALEIYQYFEDFFVNGMPCDHVNSISAQDEHRLTWEMSQDIHAKHWKNGNCSYYYLLRKATMDGMLEDTDYFITMDDPFHYTLQRKA